MVIRSHPLTYADLERARETTTDRLELVEGEIFMTPSPTPFHQLIVHRLAVVLDRAIVESGRGLVLESPLDVYFDEQNILQPDVVVLLRDRKDLLSSKNLEGAPNLAIEVVSPSSSAFDRRRKRDLYARHGVPEYWVVDPAARTVTIYGEARDGRYQTEHTDSNVAVSATIPDLSVELSALFAPPFAD
jgi:Uma2 family endonuclease